MQAALKFFDFPFNSAGGQGANKIGIKLPDRTLDQLSGDENGFMEIMAALTKIPLQELKTSLAQLDWVPVEDSAGEFAPLIDLTDPASCNSSMLQMLLLQQGSDGQTPPLPSQVSVGQADGHIDAGKNTSVLEMIKTAEGQRQQAQDGPPRAVPTQVMPPDGTPRSEPALTAWQNDAAADQNAVLPTFKGARLALADRAAETAGQSVEQAADKTNTASLPSDPKPLLSSTLKKWLGNQTPGQGKPLSGESLGRQPFQAESSEHTILQERSQPNDRFVSAVSDRQAALAQKMPGEIVAVAQEAGLKVGEKAKQQPLHRAVGIDASPAMREEQFVVKASAGVEMQLSSNTSREGAPSFDSQLNTTAPHTVDASGAPTETTPFGHKDAQTDVIRQIVQRMTLKNGRQQSQMVIRLKPDFLGNVRLQVTTEGQQVMVRMDAESAAVKEIVEQNMAHLKAELHQHGLQIEKFDVFVGNNNDGWSNGQQQAAFRQAFKHSGRTFNDAQPDDESLDRSDDSDNHGPRARTITTSEVDYFV